MPGDVYDTNSSNMPRELLCPTTGTGSAERKSDTTGETTNSNCERSVVQTKRDHIQPVAQHNTG